jgi:hypothetical protein
MVDWSFRHLQLIEQKVNHLLDAGESLLAMLT